jgi:integrase
VKVPLDGPTEVSAFIVPKRYVKGRKAEKVLVCNSVAQSVVDAQRGKHGEFVFVYRRERVKRLDEEPKMPYGPVARMSNSGWETERAKAGLGDLHIHDLRHTVGMRLREAGVSEATVADVLWHSRQGMTAHYSVAQVREVFEALERIAAPSTGRNVSLLSLVSERRFNQNSTRQRKTG